MMQAPKSKTILKQAFSFVVCCDQLPLEEEDASTIKQPHVSASLFFCGCTQPGLCYGNIFGPIYTSTSYKVMMSFFAGTKIIEVTLMWRLAL
jgi:hypothetical protein